MNVSTQLVCGIAVVFAAGLPASAAKLPPPPDRLVALAPAQEEGNLTAADLRHARRAGFVHIDFEGLREFAASDPTSRPNVLIEPFPGSVVELDGKSLFINKSATIVGQLANGESGVFILSWAGNIMYGMLEAGFDRYIFESNVADQWGTLRVKEIDSGSFAPCAEDGSAQELNPVKSPTRRMAKDQPANHTVVEMTILYSPAMAANHSGDPSAFINTLEASVTAAMTNSSVTGSARVVRYDEFSFSENAPFASNDFVDTRDLMKAWSSPFGSIWTDLYDYRADVAFLLIDGDAVGDDLPNGTDSCGISDIVSGASLNSAYGVVSDGCAAGDLTFAHEVSHLLGGRHNWGNRFLDSALDGDAGWTPGTGHGYTNSSPLFRTVMGQTGGCSPTGCARLSRYSDPDQTATVGGSSYALGVADDWASETGNQRTDMVDVLANSVSAVANYRYENADPAPSQPSSLTVDRLCSGNNELSWPAPSGTTGWYEVESSSSSGYSPAIAEYRGGLESMILHVSGTKYVRVRACNAEGCSAWRNGSQTATTTCP